MPDWLTNVFSLTKEISSKVALPVFVTLALVLFLPEPYAGKLGIIEFRNAYRIWVGVLFILSAAALISNLLWVVGSFIKPWVRQWMFIRVNSGSLRSLTEDEKAILRMFIHNGQSSVSADVNTGPINLLVHKNIVKRASNLALYYTTFAYLIQPWAKEYLEKHPELLS